MLPDGLRVNYRVAIEIEGGQRPACVAEPIALHTVEAASPAVRLSL